MLSLYLVTDFITARRSAGRAASRVFAGGLEGVPVLPRIFFRMLELFQPPVLVRLVFMLKYPDPLG